MSSGFPGIGIGGTPAICYFLVKLVLVYQIDLLEKVRVRVVRTSFGSIHSDSCCLMLASLPSD